MELTEERRQNCVELLRSSPPTTDAPADDLRDEGQISKRSPDERSDIRGPFVFWSRISHALMRATLAQRRLEKRAR
jgi:hypothetical protein